MKNLKLYKISYLIISGALIVTLCSCTKKENKTKEEQNLTTTIEIFTEKINTTLINIQNKESTTSNSITNKESSYKKEETTTETKNPLTENDYIILEHFKELGQTIKDNINSSEILEKGKAYFVYCVDFLFYDKEIKGIKFSDLSDKAKEQLLNDINLIDELICSKYPNYKETISEKNSNAYNKASEIIKKGSKNIEEFSKEKLGEDNYNKIVDEIKEQSEEDKEALQDLFKEGKEKVKNWYEGLK